MKGDRVEVVVDTGHGTQTFEILASRAGRRLEVTTGRGVVEVTELTRGGTPVRTGRFMASRVVALVEHPALEEGASRVEVETRRRMSAGQARSGRARDRGDGGAGGSGGRRRDAATDQLQLIAEEAAAAREPDAVDQRRRVETGETPAPALVDDSHGGGELEEDARREGAPEPVGGSD